MVANGTAQMAYCAPYSSWFERRRGMALALVMSGGAIGAMVLPPAAEALVRLFGWRRACLTLGVMVLVVGLPTVIRFVRQRPISRFAATQAAAGASVREGLTSRVFWILVAVLFCSSIAQNGAITHMAALLTDRSVPASGAAIAVAAMGGASLSCRTPPDRMAARPLFRGTRVLHAARGLRVGNVRAVGRALVDDGRGRGRAHRLRDGRRGRRHALHAVAILRAPVIFDALRFHVDGLRVCRRHRSDP